jgi:hypothetical protein
MPFAVENAFPIVTVDAFTAQAAPSPVTTVLVYYRLLVWLAPDCYNGVEFARSRVVNVCSWMADPERAIELPVLGWEQFTTRRRLPIEDDRLVNVVAEPRAIDG